MLSQPNVSLAFYLVKHFQISQLSTAGTLAFPCVGLCIIYKREVTDRGLQKQTLTTSSHKANACACLLLLGSLSKLDYPSHTDQPWPTGTHSHAGNQHSCRTAGQHQNGTLTVVGGFVTWTVIPTRFGKIMKLQGQMETFWENPTVE